MASKYLPLETHPLITSECWTYYKMAIIQTIPGYETWLANHLKIFTNERGITHFGENGKLYPLSYYSEILEIKEQQLSSVSYDKIIEFAINEIDKGNYLIIDSNLNALRSIQNCDIYFHETLIYGYDTLKQEFKTSILNNNVFKDYYVSFSAFKKSYVDILEYYNRNPQRLFERRRFYYGITLIKPKTNYLNDNACYEFIEKLNLEVKGASCTTISYPYSANQTEQNSYVTGLSCLYVLIDNLKKDLTVFDTSKVKDYRIACLKIYENQNILLKSLNWFSYTYTANENTLNTLILNYADCCKQLYNCVLSFYKYQLTPNQNLLSSITTELDTIFNIETELLKQLIYTITKQYSNYLNNSES